MLFCKKIRMKNGLLIFNVILLILVGVLFYLHFSSNGNKEKRVLSQSTLKTDPAGNDFRIAYFELDSITNSFSMVKDIKNDLNREEEKMNGEMNQWQKRYNDKLQQYQSQAQQMNQVQSENANRDMLQMQETIRNKKQELDQKYQNLYMQKMQDVKIKIENFLKEYNKSKGYSYIFAYEPGFIYYRDTMFNITADLVKGLNEQYSKKK
jgi:outer membrane protein